MLFLAGMAILLGGPASAEVFTIWHYETGALAQAWVRAVQLFQASHPGVTVRVNVLPFEEARVTSAQVLGGSSVPDVMEINKGNANAGTLASLGLLKDLSAEVSARGWALGIPEGLQAPARYDARGVMGSGSWFGVPSYGEVVLLYYNADLLRQAGVRVPGSLAQLETAFAALSRMGSTPLALSAAEYPAQHLLYELFLATASRSDVAAYQFYRGPVDFRGPSWTGAAATLARWAASGYFGVGSSSLDAAGQLREFRAGRSAFLLTGSWTQGDLQADPPPFSWGTMLFPGNTLHPGASGNLWAVPSRSPHPEWALEFIGLTLRSEVQTVLANAGGLALKPDLSRVTNRRALELVQTFQRLVRDDALAYYPDWPARGFYDSLVSGTAELIAGVPPRRVLDGLNLAYHANSGRR